jgi:predicted amidophosphoribosyltransferase
MTVASKNHINAGTVHSTPPRCLGCHRPLVYGDRCPDCQRKLRQRRKRKPR